ncbi:MAG: hypothetical protein JSR71_04820 [Proteobacteria bacterium]|nr:hypothetical protein [Pseudomonadota bacterium]
MSIKPGIVATHLKDASEPVVRHRGQATLIAALLRFFVIALDAVVVNLAFLHWLAIWTLAWMVCNGWWTDSRRGYKGEASTA